MKSIRYQIWRGRRHRERHGVSLLEVMFSIGVIAIGLLGVTAVIPVAMQQVGRGRVLDRAARMSENAAHDFFVRGMANPQSWRDASGSPTAAATTADVGYAIDPMFVAQNGSTVQAPYDPTVFPYHATTTDPRLVRLSLASPVTGLLRWAEAERIFVLQDELVFNVPEEDLVPPVQDFGSGAVRSYEGSMSWMATLAPTLDTTNEFRDSYRLSIVIFQGRDREMAMDGVTERLLAVDTSPGSGLSGGDVILRTKTDEPDDLLGIQDGQWLMLLGKRSGLPLYRWYRVIHADGEPIRDTSTNPNTFILDVTLDGADWPVGIPTEALYMPNVVAVHERTIRLESSSLWAN